LKPANVMRKTGGKIVIVDFGLSKSDSNGSATMAGASSTNPLLRHPGAR